jgi:transcriptional regulator of acetoin/glycerol metabolism
MKSIPMFMPQSGLQTILHETRLDRASVGTNRLLIEAIAGRAALVLLLNCNGVLLQLLGDPRALERANRIGIVPGCQMSENSIGTDAISCSLALGRPTSIAFAEHYIEVGHEWAGSAAPLHQPFTNEIVGCLSIYGHGDLAHPNALHFVTAAAQLVESELQNLETRARFILLKKYERRRTEFPNDELICVSRDGIACAGSTGALSLLGLPPMESGDLNGFVRVLDILGSGFDRNLQSRQVQLLCKRGDHLKADLLPVVDDGELIGFVGVLAKTKAVPRKASGTSGWAASHTFADIVGGKGKLAERIAEAQRVAREAFPVLITGESGTGKELFAHAIHNESARRSGPFVAINCGGVSDELLSAELFGYADGAFTGAARGGKTGKMELANGGTLFLDEAEAMSPRMQVHLLRGIEEGRVTPIGADKPKPVDVRIVAATNVDLQEKAKDGSFRRDLYYRLSVFSIAVPPLRERRDDIALLVRHFLSQMGDYDIADTALTRLESYCWPGNVRQLRNVLQQAAVRSSNQIITSNALADSICTFPCQSSDCGFPSAEQSSAAPVGPVSLREAEREMIVRALRECSGNISRTAAQLGIHRVTLHRKMETLGIRIGRMFA